MTCSNITITQLIVFLLLFFIDGILEGIYQLCVAYNRIHIMTHLSSRCDSLDKDTEPNYRTSYRQQPASRCCSAALCKRKAASLVCHGPICRRSDRLRESHHTHYSWLHWRLTWLGERAGGQIEEDCNARAGVCLRVYAAKGKESGSAQEKSMSAALYFSHVKSAALCGIFKLSSVRVASFCAPVPPCCSPTLRRNATSDVGSSSSSRKTSRGSTCITLMCTYPLQHLIYEVIQRQVLNIQLQTWNVYI